MKKLLSVLLISGLCFALCSCGKSTLPGGPTAFENANGSFSIELPAKETENKDRASWIINEDTNGDILDMTDSGKTVRVLVQGVSKAKASNIASDLESYKKYASEVVFADFIKEASMKDASMKVPDFVKNSSSATYSAKKTEGVIVFMETEQAYYTYLVVAADGGYSANGKIFKQSILSLKEITDVH